MRTRRDKMVDHLALVLTGMMLVSILSSSFAQFCKFQLDELVFDFSSLKNVSLNNAYVCSDQSEPGYPWNFGGVGRYPTRVIRWDTNSLIFETTGDSYAVEWFDLQTDYATLYLNCTQDETPVVTNAYARSDYQQVNNHVHIFINTKRACPIEDVQFAPAPNVTRMGCHRDITANRDLRLYRFDSGPSVTYMSVRMCATLCASVNTRYMAVQNGNECFCGNSYGSAGNATNCNVPCANNPSGGLCGGPEANDVYRLNDQNPFFSTGTYLGCYNNHDGVNMNFPFTDGTDVPYTVGITSDNVITFHNTPNTCIQICGYLNFKYAGVMYDKCFCSDDESYDRFITGDCRVKCQNNQTLTCGGNYASSIYAVNKYEVTTSTMYAAITSTSAERSATTSAHNSVTTSTYNSATTSSGALYATTTSARNSATTSNRNSATTSALHFATSSAQIIASTTESNAATTSASNSATTTSAVAYMTTSARHSATTSANVVSSSTITSSLSLSSTSSSSSSMSLSSTSSSGSPSTSTTTTSTTTGSGGTILVAANRTIVNIIIEKITTINITTSDNILIVTLLFAPNMTGCTQGSSYNISYSDAKLPRLTNTHEIVSAIFDINMYATNVGGRQGVATDVVCSIMAAGAGAGSTNGSTGSESRFITPVPMTFHTLPPTMVASNVGEFCLGYWNDALRPAAWMCEDSYLDVDFVSNKVTGSTLHFTPFAILRNLPVVTSSSSPSDPPSAGIIVGAIFGVLGGVLLIAVIAFFVLKRSRRFRKKEQDLGTIEVTMDALISTHVYEDASILTRDSTTSRGRKGSIHRYAIESTSVKLFEKLGQGSSGVVYRGEWRGNTVAVKELLHVTEQEKVAFTNEAELMKNLPPHPNLILLYGVVTAPRFMILTEYMVGGSLASKLLSPPSASQTALDAADIHRLILGIALGMNHLHSEGIVHRDLAARNILVDAGWNAKVADFGMSREVVAEDVNHTNNAVGPLKWMSPESLLDKTYSKKSDVWSFGVVMWEILYRRVPYGTMSAVQAAIEVARNGLRLEIDEENTPGMYKDIMRRCWQQDPEQRPTFMDIVQMLKEDNNI
eukprot:TRINITY_DN17653_c0_g1_i5.p1 TRINITY_DN17653_c0_g1~~TRINITY_DN17653_c0_g1_i5.p1  ORF type:complete len:1080 (+),score=151.93 TRINITY_DN17653_c0_g1_i5:26-3265(+)